MVFSVCRRFENEYFVTTKFIGFNQNKEILFPEDFENEFHKIMSEDELIEELFFNTNGFIMPKDWDWEDKPVMHLNLYAQ